MKSQRGVTLSSLIVYIITLLIALSILARIRMNFQSNLKEIEAESTSVVESDKINLFLLQETKKAGAFINDIADNYVEFNNGNRYLYVSDDKAIYLCNNNHIIRIAGDIVSCKFTKEALNEKTSLKMELNIEFTNGKIEEKNFEYILNR